MLRRLLAAGCIVASVSAALADDATIAIPSPVEIETARADMQAAIARYNRLMYDRLEAATKASIKGKDAWWSDCLAKPACIEWLHSKPAADASK
jgi:hypothetical protein